MKNKYTNRQLKILSKKFEYIKYNGRPIEGKTGYWSIKMTLTPTEYFILVDNNIIKFETKEQKERYINEALKAIKAGRHYAYVYHNDNSIEQKFIPESILDLNKKDI